MSWGFCCGDGWFDLINQLSAAIEAECQRLLEAGMPEDNLPIARQVKEKSSLLRFHTSPFKPPPTIQELIHQACTDSEFICGECGGHQVSRNVKHYAFCPHQTKIHKLYSGENSMTVRPERFEEMLDATYMRAVLENYRNAGRKALFEISYLQEEIGNLQTQDALPPRYQRGYGKLTARIEAIKLAINEVMDPEIPEEFWALEYTPHLIDEAPPYPELISEALRVAEKINAAEIHFLAVMKSGYDALANHAEQGLIDWNPGQFNFEFSVLLDAGPTRIFYEGGTDGTEPLRIPVLGYVLDHDSYDPSYNWNPFHREDHPLWGIHVGYLLHCIIEHSHISWKLLPSIRNIEVNLTFSDCEDLLLSTHDEGAPAFRAVPD